MRRHLPVAIVIILVLILVNVGLWYMRTDSEAWDQLLTDLELMRQPEAEGMGGSGFIEAVQIDIASELGGPITVIHAREGDTVSPGDILVELDSSTLRAQIRQAEAAVEAARAQLARVKAGIRPQEMRQLEAALAQAEAARDGARQAWLDAVAARENPQQLLLQITAAETELAVSEQQLRQSQAILRAAGEQKKLAEDALATVSAGTDIEITLAGGITVSQHIEPTEEQLRQTRFQANQAEDQWLQARMALEMAPVQVDGARTHLANLRTMRDESLVLMAQVDAAQTRFQVAEAATEGAEARLALARAGASDHQIRLAEAVVLQAEARLRTLQVQLDKMTLRSPTDGTVTERVAREGEKAMPGATLLRLGKLSPVTLTIYVAEPDLGKLRIGQPAQVRVDALPDRVFSGEIVFIASEAEFTPKNVQTRQERANLVFAVKIRLPNSDGFLKSGMPADAVIE